MEKIVELVVCPIAVVFVVWAAKILYNVWKSKRKDVIDFPSVRIFMKGDYTFQEISDPNFDSKIEWATLLLRKGEKNFIKLIPETTFKISNLSKEEREVIKLKMIEKTNIMQKQIEIFLMRPITHDSEYSICRRIVINSLLTRAWAKHDGSRKIEIFRSYELKILFSVWLLDDDIKDMASKLHISFEELKRELFIPGLRTAATFTLQQTLTLVIPKMIFEIYRLSSEHGFDLKTPHWQNLYLYDIAHD